MDATSLISMGVRAYVRSVDNVHAAVRDMYISGSMKITAVGDSPAVIWPEIPFLRISHAIQRVNGAVNPADDDGWSNKQCQTCMNGAFY